MSLKENVNYVKDELNTEEKFLEGFVKVERFYKKNKLIIIATLILIIGGTIGFFVTQSIKDQNKLEANIAFNTILENPKDSQALTVLQEKNQQLFQLAQFIQDTKEGKTPSVEVKFLKELSTYQAALKEANIEKLNSVSMQKDFLLKEFAIFNKALILTENGKFEDAKATLKLIPSDSKVADLVKVLNHYLVTK